uniref:General transcription factor IIF subunit 2 n=1 Tax=Biomphalaria glabrata TaxID=6526 RepID=A0A2C9LS11_BIOGL
MSLDLEKAHEPRDVDISAAGRGVWLVKVPKYLSEQWKTCANGTEVGKLRISKPRVSSKPDIVFTSFDVSKKAGPVLDSNGLIMPTTSTLPKKPTMVGSKNHKFIVTNVGNQNLVVMSQLKTEIPGKDTYTERISVEGKVVQRAECHPIVDDQYKQLKKDQVQAQNTPQRQVKLLTTIVQSYKPVNDHISNEERKTKKVEKRSRVEKEKVMDVLFNAFEKHQFYNVKDLVGITKQPVPYLKEILKEICNYNMTAPHKNMWELKPEFRHYKSHDETT